MAYKDRCDLIKREFAALGFDAFAFNKTETTSGPDCWVRKSKDARPFSVELKVARRQGNRIRVDRVERERQHDDFIAIILNNEYVLIEPMADHLKLCSQKGTRSLTIFSGVAPQKSKRSRSGSSGT